MIFVQILQFLNAYKNELWHLLISLKKMKRIIYNLNA